MRFFLFSILRCYGVVVEVVIGESDISSTYSYFLNCLTFGLCMFFGTN